MLKYFYLINKGLWNNGKRIGEHVNFFNTKFKNNYLFELIKKSIDLQV